MPKQVKASRRCLACKAAKVVARGLCERCWRAAMAAVDGGLVTWAKIEAQGKALPSERDERAKRMAFFTGKASDGRKNV